MSKEAAGKAIIDVTVVLMDGGLSSTAIMPAEIFHCAGALWNDLHGTRCDPRFRVRIVTVHGDTALSPYGVSLVPEGSIGDVTQTDIIIVPTSGLDLDLKLVENSALLPWLRQHHADGAYVVGVCMGAAYLAEAGLLDGRIATTHWAVADLLARRYPKVNWKPELFVTEDSRLLCSGGVCSSMDVSLYLVEKLCGHEVAVQCAKALLLPMPRILQSGWSMVSVSRAHDDGRIRAIEEYLHANYCKDCSIQSLADRAGLGARTFVRHFKSATGRLPAAYVQALRIESAKAMLERDSTPVQAISAEVGYDDVAFFQGLVPAQHRHDAGRISRAFRAAERARRPDLRDCLSHA